MPEQAAQPSRLALDNFGNVICNDVHIIKGETLVDLIAAVEARLERLRRHTGGFRLDGDFAERLPVTIERFNRLASSGRDEDFQRGENPIELSFNGPARRGNDSGNPTMFPISDRGPYYATIVCAGLIDTKGGPVTTPCGEVLDESGRRVPGLYAVGNCAASATGQGYPAGGGTIGPIFTAAYLAGQHAAQQSRR